MKNTFLAKTYTLTLTVPRAIALGIGSLILISWFFFLGLIVGRGYEPENIIPQVAQIMPQPGENAPLHPEDSGRSATDTAAVDAERQNQQSANNGRTIIADADRAYRANIKQEGATDRQGTPPSLKPPAAGQQTGQTASQAGQRPGQTGQRPGQQPGQTGQQPGQTGQQAGDTTTYAYVYQLASFKEEAAAQALKNKLQQAGFKTRINSSKGSKSTWYRVVIDFAGTNAQAEAAKARLKKDFKLGEPLKLSQKKSG